MVLSGALTVLLGERRYRVTENQCAEFDTMLPHAFGAEGGIAPTPPGGGQPLPSRSPAAIQSTSGPTGAY